MREDLSESELRVLRYLPSNLSAPEIGAEIYRVSPQWVIGRQYVLADARGLRVPMHPRQLQLLHDGAAIDVTIERTASSGLGIEGLP